MKKTFLILMSFVVALFFVSTSFAQQQTVEYPSGYAVDMDLDGLTDEGEKNIFHTDPNNSDTDGDGYYDGVEVINGTDPLDENSFIAPEEVVDVDMEPSWAWYLTRATALIGFLLLYIVIFLGLTVRLPYLNRIFSPLTSLKVHAWLSVQALLFAATHGAALMFDKFLKFSWVDVFIPFASFYETDLVAMGTIGFYIMILLILTSYFRHLMSHRIWRISHFLNIVLYGIIIIHALRLGTDLKNPGINRDVFIWSNVLLVVLFALNLTYQLVMVIKRKLASRKINDMPTQ